MNNYEMRQQRILINKLEIYNRRNPFDIQKTNN
ncbi:hypothetical protein AEQU1_02045 [Aequorivita sp. CIP111184]|nr:hypothetical protein AEQU1_02045 [Aequorivita sp. CIP111184]